MEPEELERDWVMKFRSEVGEPLTSASILMELLESGDIDNGLFFPSFAEPGLRNPDPPGDWKSLKSNEKAELGRFMIWDRDCGEPMVLRPACLSSAEALLLNGVPCFPPAVLVGAMLSLLAPAAAA